MKETLTVNETAKILGIAPQGVRVQMQRGLLPIGTCLPCVNGKGYRYLIFRDKLNAFIGKENHE